MSETSEMNLKDYSGPQIPHFEKRMLCPELMAWMASHYARAIEIETIFFNAEVSKRWGFDLAMEIEREAWRQWEPAWVTPEAREEFGIPAHIDK